ncbi:hypothetical protein PACTADRAFT_48844 [Pachysolen tannophilus NRRL Y-2460]|uniref:Arginine N-methyltransferase 2 n=1 Tax=Pachysolen tannophilus NRRL Y-2460 TaxID=669874 RepID=A0A1E4TZC2_PACTA|nr:hypothetical protein PACTADRAFT_48844 [Pachysolen tannophilus NRRL Y-2460]
MSELHELCYFKTRPITEDEYLVPFKSLLKAGIPSTYTLEEAERYNAGKSSGLGPGPSPVPEQVQEVESNTTPLHLICENIPVDYSKDEEKVILQLIEELFLRGAGWCLINDKDETPGCVLNRRNLAHTSFWNVIVDAGVRAEVLLRKITDSSIEFIEDEQEQAQEQEQEQEQEEEVEVDNIEVEEDPSNTPSVYLKTKLAYKDDALVTEGKGDGVMMQWEDQLMAAGCKSLFKNASKDSANVLNIGFGMGIIDTMINKKNPSKHYICEAHPDVLAKMKQDGWFEKPNVTILAGRWQDTLPELLSSGIFFDGIYFDTYSEHYEDMLELFDLVVGLLKSNGVFSFFNGLGADRLVVYEVYKKIVELDLTNYGLKVNYTEINAPKTTLHQTDGEKESVWKDIKRPYWRCPIYYHPEVEFI